MPLRRCPPRHHRRSTGPAQLRPTLVSIGRSMWVRAAISCPVPVKRVSLLVWRVKRQEKVLSLPAGRIELVEKGVAGQEPRVDGQESVLSLHSFFPVAPGPENGAPGAGPGASGGKSEAPGPRPVRTHSFPGATDKFDAPTLSAGVGPLGNGRRTVPESARRLEKRAATVGTLPVSGRKRRRLRCGE